MRTLEYTGDNAAKFGDAWAESLVFSELDDTGATYQMDVPTAARIALYSDRAKTAAVALSVTCTVAASGLGYSVSWSSVLALAAGTYYGDLQLDYATGPTPWTPVDIVLQVVTDYAGAA